MKKNVVFDTRWLKSGGIGRFCKEMMSSKSLKECRFLKGDLSDVFSIKDIYYLVKVILKNDFFITPGYNSPVFSKGKAIVTLHDLMHLRYPKYLSFKNSVYYNLIVKRVVQSAPLVFTVSDFTRKEIAEWANIPLEKISVIPNGVDHDYYHFNVLPINRDKPYFFYVGNNKPHKNLMRLIEAFSDSSLHSEVDLLISCSPTKELNLLIDNLGLSSHVIFLSGIDEGELPNYYKGALATVVVTLYEGFCLPILESMAVGTPVITSNITAMPEVAGGAAILVDPYHIDSIKMALQSISNDKNLRLTLSEKGLIRAKEFSWDKSRMLWDKALLPILEGK